MQIQAKSWSELKPRFDGRRFIVKSREEVLGYNSSKK